ACSLKLLDETQGQNWGLERAVWGFEALGTNAAPALEGLLALFDDDGNPYRRVDAAIIALGPVAVPDLVKRLRSTNWVTSVRTGVILRYLQGPAADSAIPLLVAM